MNHPVRVERFEIQDPQHGVLPAIALAPSAAAEALPVCLFLYGGGGSHETLLALEPLLGSAWADGSLPPLFVACLGVPPFCFYLDDPERASFWQSAVSESLLDGVRARFAREVSSSRAGLVGVSMGGYGALKIALDKPHRFGAVAALAPMLEPDATGDAPLRNRFHYPELVPPALLGEARDRALFERDHPSSRARANSAEIIAAELAIWLDAGGRDALHAHDGAEALHRTLWELDIPHEYHLRRDADHVGPTLAPRLLEAFHWVGKHRVPYEHALSDEERALHDYLSPLRALASLRDESFSRRYGRLLTSASVYGWASQKAW